MLVKFSNIFTDNLASPIPKWTIQLQLMIPAHHLVFKSTTSPINVIENENRLVIWDAKLLLFPFFLAEKIVRIVLCCFHI